MFHIADDPDVIILDFKDALIIDHSAVAAIQGLTHRYGLAGKLVILNNINSKCVGRMNRTHGDRTKLKEQMGHTVADVEGGTPTDTPTSTGTNAEAKHIENLQQLEMFTTEIGGHDKELEVLAMDAEKFTVESVKKNK